MNFHLNFHKFHGAGNDFILIDARNEKTVFDEKFVRFLCDRHTGIGADGLILLEVDTAGADFFMRYFNADGREASLCGNGSRCAVAFADFLQIIDKKCHFNAYDGIHYAEILNQSQHQWKISLKMQDVDKIEKYEDGYFTDTGSPHFVIFVTDAGSTDVYNEGKQIGHSGRFPGGANVNFVSLTKEGLFVRTFERGVEDETLSCGTGVTASALIWTIHHQIEDGEIGVNVKTKGGELQVNFEKKNHLFKHIFLIGPVVHTFSGTLSV